MPHTAGNERYDIADICRRMYTRQLVVGTSGNVSIRDQSAILITPHGIRKEEMTFEDIVSCSLDGSVSNGTRNPSSEIAMHVAAYERRRDIGAVIHAHPPYCVACSLLGISLKKLFLPELVVYVGPAPTVPYAAPGSAAQADAVKPYIATHNSMLLERHGVLVLGKSLGEAFSRLEQLEYAAHIAYLVRSNRGIESLHPNEIDELIARASSSRTPAPPAA